MATYVILTDFLQKRSVIRRTSTPSPRTSPVRLRANAQACGGKIAVPLLGRFDVVDIVEADDPKQLEKVAMIIRAYGHSTPETLVATKWDDFLAML